MLSLKTPQFSSGIAPAATRGSLSNSFPLNAYTKHLKIIDGISVQFLRTSNLSEKRFGVHRFKKKSETNIKLPILKFKVSHAS